MSIESIGTVLALAALVATILIVITFSRRSASRRGSREESIAPLRDVMLYPRKLLTVRERRLYRRLTEAFPGKPVMVNVAVRSCIGTKGQSDEGLRGRLANLEARFVVCDEGFRARAVFDVCTGSDCQRCVERESRKAEILAEAGVPFRVLSLESPPTHAELLRLLPDMGGAGPAAKRDSHAVSDLVSDLSGRFRVLVSDRASRAQ